ncbi:GlxA family transcriptional regulator [Paraburkholderia sp. BCC1884]|uniref:GlxA family transcriptional regulator n=1 Tax=Paraburkholderia sp. BCC1884 TaxID=2562668 RepID=UPI0021B2CBD4|nr:AraC family transcriptional regulator [Paraburkholderia sp. BCC1884]
MQAQHLASRKEMRRVFFVVPPQVHMLDLGGPLQILSSLSALGIAPIETVCVGPQKEIKSFQGVTLSAVRPLPARLGSGDVVIVVGCKFSLDEPFTPAQSQIVKWLQTVVKPLLGDIVLASVCTGAFLLGAAGLLDQRDCTTHHDHLARLQQRHPDAHVLSNRLLVEDGALITSAGVSAGIDLALHLIACRFGAATAIRVARENVVPFRRMSRDPILDVQLRYRDHNHLAIHAIQDFLTEQPGCALPYQELASRFALSYRHLARLFQQECGITVKKYQQQLRLALARRLLKCSSLPIERIAEHCGFASVQAFRSAWRQEEVLAPSLWRIE